MLSARLRWFRAGTAYQKGQIDRGGDGDAGEPVIFVPSLTANKKRGVPTYAERDVFANKTLFVP